MRARLCAFLYFRCGTESRKSRWRNLEVSYFVGLGDMKKAARTTKRAPISRAQQIFSIRRRLAFLSELEGRLKEQAAVLDAHKPSRRSPSRLPELFDSPALLFRRSVNPKVVQLLPGAKLRH